MAATGILAAGHSYGWSPQDLMVLGFGCAVSTLFLSPDIDLKQSISSRSWGIFRFLWIPYHRVFRHRGLSHWPIIGTLSRIVYLFVFFEILSYGYFAAAAYLEHWDALRAVQASTDQVYLHKQNLIAFARENHRYLLVFFYGLALTDGIHTLVDWLSSFWKRLVVKS